MVAGWAHLVILILAIVGVASGSWLVQDYTEEVETGRAGMANITTEGHFGLAHYTVTRTIRAQTRTFYEHESGSIKNVVDIGALAGLSGVALTFIILEILTIPVSAGFTFYHAWARGPPRLMYIVSCSLTGAITLFSLLAILLYAGVMPKADGFKMGWGFWVTFVVTLLDMVVFFLDLTLKPEGIPYYKRAATSEENAGAGAQMTPVTTTRQTTSPAAAPAARSSPQTAPATKSSAPAASKPLPQPPKPKSAGPQKKMLRAKFDCTPDQDGDLAFKEGDMIELVSEEPGDGWVTGRLNGQQGIVPSNYVERV